MNAAVMTDLDRHLLQFDPDGADLLRRDGLRVSTVTVGRQVWTRVVGVGITRHYRDSLPTEQAARIFRGEVGQ